MSVAKAELPNIPEIDPTSVIYIDGKDVHLNYDSLPKIQTVSSVMHEVVGTVAQVFMEDKFALVQKLYLSENI